LRKGGTTDTWVRLRPYSLALWHHLAVHGAGATITAMVNTGQTAGGHPAIGAAAGRSQKLRVGGIWLGQGRTVEAGHNSLAGDIPSLLVNHAGSLETAAALVHLTPWSLKVDSAAALPGAIGSHLARAKVLTVAGALPCGWVGEKVPQAPPL
jgi:hypothetical protein